MIYIQQPCTYQWLREDGSPYYVGKGSGSKRALISAGHTVRRPKDSTRILIQYWPDGATAKAYEIYLIDFWGRLDLGTGCLRNRTDGGEGFNHTVSAETRQKISESKRGRKNGPHTAGTKLKMSRQRLGKGGQAIKALWQSPEYRDKVVKSRMGMTRPHLAKLHTSEHQSQAAKSARHIQWHVNRNIVKNGCTLCTSV